jgi:uncharacterized protein (DUF2141 family)
VTLTLAAATAKAADLTVTVKNVRNPKGSVMIAVFDQSNYDKVDRTKIKQQANAATGDVTFVFHDIPAGTYAVAAYHDENGNGKLDRNFLHIPTEGYGFSNDARGTTRSPSFSASKFSLDGKTDKAIAFSIKY